jgi:E3 ubiquitin-protein ligase HERC2
MRCNWGICEACWQRIQSANIGSVSATLTKQLLSTENSTVGCLLTIVQLLNTAMVKALPFIDLTKGESIPNTLAALVCKNRDLLLDSIKRNIFDSALQSTAGSGGMFDLHLSRFKARRNINSNKVDTEGRWSVFSQAFRVMHFMPARNLRRSDRLYNTMFMGEHAQDAGGPYR